MTYPYEKIGIDEKELAHINAVRSAMFADPMSQAWAERAKKARDKSRKMDHAGKAENRPKFHAIVAMSIPFGIIYLWLQLVGGMFKRGEARREYSAIERLSMDPPPLTPSPATSPSIPIGEIDPMAILLALAIVILIVIILSIIGIVVQLKKNPPPFVRKLDKTPPSPTIP